MKNEYVQDMIQLFTSLSRLQQRLTVGLCMARVLKVLLFIARWLALYCMSDLIAVRNNKELLTDEQIIHVNII